MKTKAAVLTDRNVPWEIMELDVRDPKENEVLIRYMAAGLCHSDEHLVTGDIVAAALRRWPRGRRDHRGDRPGRDEGRTRATTSSARSSRPAATAAGARPACRACATWARRSSTAACPTARSAFHETARTSAAMCMLGTFSQYATISEESVVKVDEDLPLEVAVLCGCGVPTGWGSAVYAGDVETGDTVVIYGIGGIGANAVQGAAHAGAANDHRRRPAGQQARGRPRSWAPPTPSPAPRRRTSSRRS